MKSKIFVRIIIGMLCLTQSIMAEVSNRSDDHEKLRNLRQSVVEGLNRQDINLLTPHLAKEFVYTGIDQTLIEDLQELNDYFEKTFKSPSAQVDSMTIEAEADIPTRFISETVGICYGTAKEVYKLKTGKEVTLNSRWTATCIKEEGKWKVSAVQSGINVLDNAVLNKTKRFWINCAWAGVLAGLILGSVSLTVICKLKRS